MALPDYTHLRELLSKRFWSRVDKSGECWLWTGSCNKQRYGQIRFNGMHWRAHRLAYSASIGPIPHGMLVCHRCDNPPCVNPAHLFLGDHSDNAADMVAKGRGGFFGLERARKARSHQVRALHPRAKLTESDVADIRRLFATGLTHTAIAAEYGVHRSNIALIVKGETWKN